jgi:hypothetical protein
MGANASDRTRIKPFISILKGIPFVGRVSIATASDPATNGALMLTVTDRRRRQFRFATEVKTSYLDRPSTNAILASARSMRKRLGHPILLLARYVPAPAAEQFVEAGVDFIDLAGNLHLALGSEYERTIIGRTEKQKSGEKQAITAAQLQLLFLFATEPEAVAWTVRDMGERAGVSKSKAAEIRRQLAESEMLNGASGHFHMSKRTEELLVSGYAQVLRPKLVIGRFRPPEKDIAAFLRRLPETVPGPHRYALTGGPAADALQHFYQGPELPLFVSDESSELRQSLRLLPDHTGPITLLRAFGDIVYWRQVSPWMVAPPWLVYSELMNSDDPRAHEAAMEFRTAFLDR